MKVLKNYITHWKGWLKSGKVKRDLVATGIYFAKGYLMFIVVMVVFQRSIMYYPTATLVDDPTKIAGLEIVTYTTADGLKLTSWYKPPQEGKPTIVFYHGNGGNISYRGFKQDHFANEGYGFLLAEYRGYSSNPGSPSEQGLYKDARAALDWLMKTKNVKENQIIIWGESIGSGPTSQMAVEHPDVKAVIYEAPITNMANEVGDVYPFVGPFKYLAFDKYDNISKAPQFKMPVLVIQGTQDEIVPPKHGKALFAAVGSKYKKYVALNGGHHNDLAQFGLFENIDGFISALK